jgi:prophage regulatory protein
MSERFVTVKETAKRVCLCKSELYDRLKAGTFPKPVALGPRKVVFLESEIDAWIRAKINDENNHAASRRFQAQKAVASRRDRRDA